MRYILVLLAVLMGCQKPVEDKKPGQHAHSLDDIIETRDLYLRLLPVSEDRRGPLMDEHGFIEHVECDSVLFSGLIAGSDNDVLDIDLLAARNDETGQWFRTPRHDCYKRYQNGSRGVGTSSSTISRDSFVGIYWWGFADGYISELVEVLEYAKRHDYVMGQGESIGRTILSANMVRTLAKITDRPEPVLPDVWGNPSGASARHLQSLHIVLRGLVTGKISQGMFDALKRNFRNDRGNAFLRAAYLIYAAPERLDEVITVLADTSYFPDTRLPRSKDRCARWLWERSSDGDDWQPCGERHVHSGGDLIFLTWLLEQYKK